MATYARIEWDFLNNTLTSINFPNCMINNIMQCVKIVSYSIMINGKPYDYFNPKMGITLGIPYPQTYSFCMIKFSLSALW